MLLFVTAISSSGQTTRQYACGDDQFRNLLRKIAPVYDTMQKRSNQQLRDYISGGSANLAKTIYKSRTNTDSGYIIPIVVHVIYPAGQPYGTGTNISYDQIRSQIEALNAAFSKDYPAFNGQSHPTYAANTNIRFCLARNISGSGDWATGPGGTEFGVMRYENSTGAYNHYISLTSANELLGITHPSPTSFPFEKYLNIWLVSTIEGADNVMGYAPRPILPGYTMDGVIMRADVFGDNTRGGGFDLKFGLSQGKILAHEVGHYFNLYHIFQGGCEGANAAGAATDACDLNGDMVCDIEPCTTQNIFCTSNIPNTCTANYATGTTASDMINDYMSYADDDCMNTFTSDQVQRMWATLALQRTNIWQPENLTQTGVLGAGGCVPAYLSAKIKTENAVFCAGAPVVFSNPVAGNTAVNYEWHFTGGNIASSTENPATVTYPVAGDYHAVLTVSDGINTSTDSLLFTVLDCKVDSSMLYMSHWYFGDYGSIDFSSGTPVQTNTALVHQTIKGESSYPGQLPYIGATVSLSDSLGNLLFYSNGVSVWNRLHQKITTAPMFGASDINASSGLCYIPYPGKKGKYFVAGVYPNFDETSSGVRFVLVDADSNTVSPYQELHHPLLPRRFSEYLTVVPHCNGTDYWIITHGYGIDGDTKFYSFLVTENGIDSSQTPVISYGLFHTAYTGAGFQLKANRAGDKLVMTSSYPYPQSGIAALYDFDSRTGEVKNERDIPDVSGYSNIQTGVAFSPNGQYFYFMRSSDFATNGPPYWLFQYRVSDLKYNIIYAPGFYFAASFQPGPDNNIYITTQDEYFNRITNTDVWNGASFNGSFINMLLLNNDIRPGVSIPSFIDARKPVPTHPDFSVNALNCNTYHFSSLCFDKYTANWNFGDGSGVQVGSSIDHHYTQTGSFTVTLTLSMDSDTFGSTSKVVAVLPLTTNISGPGFVCTNGNYPSQYFSSLPADVEYEWTVVNGTLSGPGNLPYADVAWSSSDTRGTIRLNIVRQACSFSVSKDVTIMPGPAFNWILPDSICVFDSSIVLTALPEQGKFEGPGVTGNTFNPAVAGAGNHTLTYTFFNEVTCFGVAERIINVGVCNIPVVQETDCEKMLASIVIAPNPVTNVLRLKSPYALKFAQVFNSSGQQMAQGNFVNNSFHLPNLAAGIYTVLVYCPKNMSHKAFRFFKQ